MQGIGLAKSSGGPKHLNQRLLDMKKELTGLLALLGVASSAGAHANFSKAEQIAHPYSVLIVDHQGRVVKSLPLEETVNANFDFSKINSVRFEEASNSAGACADNIHDRSR
jgi:hypothetical protein